MTYENALPPCSHTEVPLQDLFNQYHFKIKDYCSTESAVILWLCNSSRS